METISARDAALDDLAGSLRERLIREARDLTAEPGGAEHPPAGDLHARIAGLVERECGLLDPGARSRLVAMVAERSFGLGPLEPLLADPEVDEVMVNGSAGVWVERAGHIEATDVAFGSEAELRHAIDRILAPLGRRVDEASPLADARLPDGSRVNVVIPPLALDGPALTIRRFRRRGLSADELVAAGTFEPPLRDFLATCVRARCNLLVSGGTGSGKTTTLNALSAYIGEGERVVTIEDAAELRLRQRHVVRLEARPPSLEGSGEVTIRALVRNALRMRPDRIVVGEVRGAEALDMLSAMSSGHDGSLTTVHAGSPEEALRRLETLALMADVALPHAAIREQVAGSIDVVVHQARQPDGHRRVTEVAQVVRVAGGPATRQLYAVRDGRPCWRAALSDELSRRLAAAAAEAA
jgi:pilus assembly protein CpaF